MRRTNSYRTAGTATDLSASWKFSSIASIARAVTAVPLSVCTCASVTELADLEKRNARIASASELGDSPVTFVAKLRELEVAGRNSRR